CDAQSNIINNPAGGRCRPKKKYTHAIVTSTQFRRRLTLGFAADTVQSDEYTEIVQARSSAAGQNAFERFGVESESEAPVARKSFE
ncbi:hypothetical protein E4U10_000495, partial [Claviceps purpurea]